MATFKPTVHKHRMRDDKTFNVVIRLTHNRKSIYLNTPYYVGKDKLNNKYEIKDNTAIKVANQYADKFRDEIMLLGRKIDRMDVHQVAEYLRKEKGEEIDFFKFATDQIAKLTERGKIKTAATYRTTINNLRKFSKRKKLPVVSINKAFLENFEDWLRKQGGRDDGTPMSNTSINLYMRNIRAIFNNCMECYNTDEDKQIENYPFRSYKIPSAKKSEHRNLEVEVIRKIRDFKGEKYRALDEQAKDVFMISFLLIGMNTVDLFRCPKPIKGRITYNRSKVKDRREDMAKISIKVEPELEYYLEKYKGKALAFNFSERYKTSGDFNKYVNRGLNRIGKELKLPITLSTYYARHSWATIICNDLKYREEDAHKALNHANHKMEVTRTYIKEDWSLHDKMNREITDLVYGKRVQPLSGQGSESLHSEPASPDLVPVPAPLPFLALLKRIVVLPDTPDRSSSE